MEHIQLANLIVIPQEFVSIFVELSHMVAVVPTPHRKFGLSCRYVCAQEKPAIGR